MKANPNSYDPPRNLQGRRARRFWRRLAPIADASGKLTSANAPLLATLCAKLAYAEEFPDQIFKNELAVIDRLNRMFGFSGGVPS